VTYYVIERSGDSRTFNESMNVAAFFLGKAISKFIVIKDDPRGTRLVDITSASGDVMRINDLLKDA
jgi:hypothetical protein